MPFDYLKKPVYYAAPQPPAPVYMAPQLVPGEYIYGTEMRKTPQGEVQMMRVAHPSGQSPIVLQPNAMDAFMKARQAIKDQYGIDVASGVSESIRTPERVAELKALYKSGSASVPKPPASWEGSKHSVGIATDIAGTYSKNPRIVDAMAQYGFKRTVPGEYWHFQYVTPSLPGGTANVTSRQRK
jgi:D-alanyl-D-alanine dipeptidase